MFDWIELRQECAPPSLGRLLMMISRWRLLLLFLVTTTSFRQRQGLSCSGITFCGKFVILGGGNVVFW